MSKKKGKKKRTIRIETSPIRRAEEDLVKDTTGVEQLEVFKISGKVGRYLSFLMIAVGASLSILSLYVLVAMERPPWLTSNIVIALIGFLGVINTLCGLILLTKE